jgi:hypothetical protein
MRSGVDVADLKRDDLKHAQPGAAWRRKVTSLTLSTTGSRRGSRTTVNRRARSGRSSVTVKKNRRAATDPHLRGHDHAKP